MIKMKQVNNNIVGVFSDNKYKLIDQNGRILNATEKYPIFVYKDFADFILESEEMIDSHFEEVMEMYSKME